MSRTRTIFDLQLDGSDWARLRRINARLCLGIRPRWWWSTSRLRELVRKRLDVKIAAVAGNAEAAKRLMDRWE